MRILKVKQRNYLRSMCWSGAGSIKLTWASSILQQSLSIFYIWHTKCGSANKIARMSCSTKSGNKNNIECVKFSQTNIKKMLKKLKTKSYGNKWRLSLSIESISFYKHIGIDNLWWKRYLLWSGTMPSKNFWLTLNANAMGLRVKSVNTLSIITLIGMLWRHMRICWRKLTNSWRRVLISTSSRSARRRISHQ